MLSFQKYTFAISMVSARCIQGEVLRGDMHIYDRGIVDSSFIQADRMAHPASVPMEAAQAARVVPNVEEKFPERKVFAFSGFRSRFQGFECSISWFRTRS